MNFGMSDRLLKAFFCFLTSLSSSNGDNFLIMHQPTSSSHVVHLKPVAAELLRRGHQVTTLYYRSELDIPLSEMGPNHTVIERTIDNSKGEIPFLSKSNESVMLLEDVMSFDKGPIQRTLETYHNLPFKYYFAYCDDVLGNKELIERLRSANFDVALNDLFIGECGHVLTAKVLGLPVVGYWGFHSADAHMDYAGGVVSASYPPTFWSKLPGRDMTVLQRLYNMFNKMANMAMMRAQIQTVNWAAWRNGVSVSYADTLADLRGVLINRFQGILEHPVPVPRTFQYMLGAHLFDGPLEKLSEEVSEFMDGAENGVILFSMGLSVSKLDLPLSVLQNFMSAFGRLKQRVLAVIGKGHHLGNDSVPENVLIVPRVSQKSALAHPKMVMLITQSGGASAIEGIFYRLPMITMPIGFDQVDIAAFLVEKGAAEDLSIFDTSDEIFTVATRVIQEPRYRNAVSKLADLFAMERHNPLDNAAWLLEYVSKTRGAEHMKIASAEFTWIRYYCLDLVSLCLAVCYLVRRLVVAAWRRWRKFSVKKRKVD